MGLNAASLPENLRKCIAPQDRAALGRTAETFSEAQGRATAKSEKHLQGQIIGMLRREGIWPIQQRMDHKSNLAIGTPDILYVVRGIPVAWEVKMPGKNPRPEQEEAMRVMADNGWRCAVVRSYEEALALFRQIMSTARV